MAQTKLTPEEKAQVIDALNKDLEPSPDLISKLFPGTAEKFDVQALDRAKIPTLEYAGKRTKATILAEATAGIGAAPLQTVRCFGDAKEDEWRNMIIQGDNLQFLKTCYKNVDPLIKDKVKGKVKLIYIDPPFATKSDFGGKDGEYSYADKVDRAHFLETLRERLIYLRELLADDGSIYAHLDDRMDHYVKVMMDEVFGKENFLNDISWCYGERELAKRNYNKKHDSILFYAKNSNNPNRPFNCWSIALPYSPGSVKKYNLVDENGRNYQIRGKGGPYTGKQQLPVLVEKEHPEWTYRDYFDEKQGILPRDWFTDVTFENRASLSRTDYPTQKPEKLLEKFVNVSSNPGDLVMDCFAGSGTTGAVAEKLGRKWIMCDFGKHAIYTMQKRILNIADGKKLGEDVKSGEKYGQPPKSYCVVSSGAYDFSHVMDLRKNKETYIDFVLGLFQLSRDEVKANKFKLSNIYAVKDNHPVEVYPVWDDRYLKDIRIDEIYLQGIIDQAGGRLRGEYYIIAPESCANVGDTTLKNQDAKDVEFKILTFPYKILEDISQKLSLQEQPSNSADINNLVTSTSFYFNEDVDIAAERAESGIKITKFESKILDRDGNRFEGLNGLAMLLVDLNYEPSKPFDMDVAIYAKEIGENGLCSIPDLTPSVGIIAIDKHGNESKPFKLI